MSKRIKTKYCHPWCKQKTKTITQLHLKKTQNTHNKTTNFVTSPKQLICSLFPRENTTGNQADVLSPTPAKHSYKPANLYKAGCKLAFCALGIPETRAPWFCGVSPPTPFPISWLHFACDDFDLPRSNIHPSRAGSGIELGAWGLRMKAWQ